MPASLRAAKLRLLFRTAALNQPESYAGGQASNILRMVAVSADIVFNFDGVSLLPQTLLTTSSGNSCPTRHSVSLTGDWSTFVGHQSPMGIMHNSGG